MHFTLKGIPDSLHQKLREAADESGRSLNRLILYTLEQTFCSRPLDREALLGRVRRRRSHMKLWADDSSLDAAKDDGRA